MDEEGQEGPIKCIFLCKFHDELGPVIVCQYPTNYISKEVFEAINTYLISKLQMQKRTITLTVSELKVSGYPNAIKNDKYLRNVFIFNLCFVCDSKSRTVQYEPVIKKLSEYLENLELECGFLSSEESKCKLPDILAQILENLNAKGQCTIKIALENHPIMERRISMRGEKKSEVDFGKSYCGKQEKRYSSFSDRKMSENKDKGCPMILQGKNKPCISVLNLKQVTGVRPDPVQVHDHHVPILVCSRNEALHLSHHWDLTTQQILSYIDGLSHIAKIAAEADVHNNLVKACVQNLSYYRVVKLLPIFQYSNIYTTLPGLHKLYTTQEIQEDCLKSVSKNVVRLPSLATVFQMYCSLTYGLSVRDLCLRFNPHALGIDERKLIQYGLLHGFIRRLHHYPVLVPTKSNEEPPIVTLEPLYRMCNGLHSLDEISCRFGMSHQEIMDKLEKDPTNGVVIILK